MAHTTFVKHGTLLQKSPNTFSGCYQWSLSRKHITGIRLFEYF